MVARLARRNGIKVIHCRGHVPMAMGVLAKKLSGVRLVLPFEASCRRNTSTESVAGERLPLSADQAGRTQTIH